MPPDPVLLPLDVPQRTVRAERLFPQLPTAISVQNGLSPYGLLCDLVFEATPLGATMVRLEVSAPCHPSTIAEVSHGSLRFTTATGPDGALTVDLPATTTTSTFRLRFADGVIAMAEAQVPEAADYLQTAVMWQGPLPLGLVALEPGGARIDAEAPRSPQRSVHLGRGFLTQLGALYDQDSWRLAIYSTPRRNHGRIRFALEAAVTAESCGQDLRSGLAQSHRWDETPEWVTLVMPDCEKIGDVLVLKNLLRPLTLAQE